MDFMTAHRTEDRLQALIRRIREKPPEAREAINRWRDWAPVIAP